jgi:Flp pilus assembly pilin Flp
MNPIILFRNVRKDRDEDEDGQTLVEYALILALFSIAMVGTLGMFESALGDYYSLITEAIKALAG